MLRKRRRKGPEDAELALADAKKNLHEIKSRKSEVQEVAHAFRVMRERNHFAETIQAIVEGGR